MKLQDYYSDPERYDAEYAPFSIDRAWYQKRALENGGPVLELGCGTGRILFSLAHAGLRVDGLDNSPDMLARASTRAILLGVDIASRVDFYQADLTDFDLAQSYQTILAPLNCLMHLLDDESILSCLNRVRDHLGPQGRFIFDITCPRDELFDATSSDEGVPLRTIRVRGEEYLQRERHYYDPVTRISRMRYTFGPTACRGETFATELSLRMYPPDEIVRLLHLAGLHVFERFGDFKNNDLDPDSDIMQLIVAGIAN